MELNRVEKIDGPVAIRNVIVSVADKTGLDEFVRGLVGINPGIVIYSTGGTYEKIRKTLGNDTRGTVRTVSEYTGQPELQGGLVKTLDYKIYLGLLSETYNESHGNDLQRTGAVPFDMVVVNLYPFAETVARRDATLEDARTNIDIGGPCMLRASAKNFIRVASVSSPEDYPLILNELRNTGGRLSLKTRFTLAAKSFRHTAEYDGHIASYFNAVPVDSVAAPYRIEEESR